MLYLFVFLFFFFFLGVVHMVQEYTRRVGTRRITQGKTRRASTDTISTVILVLSWELQKIGNRWPSLR